MGISLPKVKHSVSGSSFCLSFTQLKRIKVCFLPNIITGYEMSHSGAFEAQQWWRKKLVHPIVTARTLPRGDRRETNTQEGKINPNSSPYFFHSFIWIQMHSVLCQSLFLKNTRLEFFCTVKLYLLFGDAEWQRFHSHCDKFPASARRQWQTKLSFTHPTPLFLF